jgi:hypothetical protein
MARPPRMGAFNALDELLPGPASDEREPEPPPAPARRSKRERGWDRDWEQPQEPVEPPRQGSGFNALDELLPGPLAARRRLKLVPERARGQRAHRGGGGGGSKHLSAYNPLDELEPEAPPPKARVNLRVSAELLEAARDASAYLSQEQQGRVTLGGLAEEALRAELHRLAVEHNSGRPFPSRPDERKARRSSR